MVKQYVSDLGLGDAIDSLFSVKYKHPPREYKNGFMFTVGLADKTGELEATYWGGCLYSTSKQLKKSMMQWSLTCPTQAMPN